MCVLCEGAGHAQVQTRRWNQIKVLCLMMCRRQGLVDTGSMPNWHVHTDSSTCIYSCIKLTTSIQLITSKQKSLPITSPTTTYHYPKSVGITYNTTDTGKKMALTYVDTHFFSRFSPFSSRLRKSFPPPYIPPFPPPSPPPKTFSFRLAAS